MEAKSKMKKLLASPVSRSAPAAFGAEAKGEIRVPADQLRWQPMGSTGASVAWVVGDDKAKGPVALFMKYPAGFDSGWHTHDGDYVATVVKGTMTAQSQGDAAETLLPVGSAFGEPAKRNHRNGCTKDGECIIFFRMEKGLTFHPMTPEGKPAPAPTDKK
jgi:quercetin dioxygenase-like cupin family protein